MGIKVSKLSLLQNVISNSLRGETKLHKILGVRSKHLYHRASKLYIDTRNHSKICLTVLYVDDKNKKFVVNWQDVFTCDKKHYILRPEFVIIGSILLDDDSRFIIKVRWAVRS